MDAPRRPEKQNPRRRLLQPVGAEEPYCTVLYCTVIASDLGWNLDPVTRGGAGWQWSPSRLSIHGGLCAESRFPTKHDLDGTMPSNNPSLWDFMTHGARRRLWSAVLESPRPSHPPPPPPPTTKHRIQGPETLKRQKVNVQNSELTGRFETVMQYGV
jgi:hypothetical protein